MSEAPQTLFVVRVRAEPYESTGCPVKSEKPLGMEGIFASREQAEAFQAELECRAARSGVPGPLLAIRSLAQLRALSAFEPEVLKDWMVDHDIPDPDTFVCARRAQEDERWLEWFRQEATHWAFYHKAPQKQEVEQWLDRLRENQEDDRYLDWMLCLSQQQRGDLYAALHHFRFYEIVEVPFVFGNYPEEAWEPWEVAAQTQPLPTWLRRERGELASPRAEPAHQPPSGSEDEIPF